MMVEEIQPGWMVYDNQGEEVGRVVSAAGPMVIAKGNNGKDFEVPNGAIANVETGRVELNMSKRDIQNRAPVSSGS